MKQTNQQDVSYENFAKMAAGLEDALQASTDLYTILAISLGRNHKYTQRARTLFHKSTYLYQHMQRLMTEKAKDTFFAKELECLFLQRRAQNEYQKKGGNEYGTYNE